MTNRITFAIGDVHGCAQKLRKLIANCERVSAGRQSRFILVGDYVDRGPDARGVIDFLVEEQHRDPHRFVCLRGNHEQMLLAAAAAGRSDSELVNWWANGGEQTLDSYGVNDPSGLPIDHLAWIEDLPLKLTEAERVYVHAGIRPGVALGAQVTHDLLWIREPFLSSDLDHGTLVVHGHTPTKSRLPELRTNRLNLDTGACFGGPLTAAMFLEDDGRPLMFINHAGESWLPE